MSSAHWWVERPEERFWLESTDRPDVGIDLRAPEKDSKGEDNWRYSLFKNAREGDLVFHYDKNRRAITSVSRIAGPPAARSITWAARGTSARARSASPVQVEGYFVPLRDNIPLSKPVTLDDLRRSKVNLAKIHENLGVKGAPVYFPFELSARPVRPLQGYAFKLPAGVVHAFPEMHDAATTLLNPLEGGEAVQQIVQDAVSAIEASAQPYQISNLQLMRAEVAGHRRSSSTIFGPSLKGKDWTFHHGGRSELQFNVGLDVFENGRQALRAGVGFSFQPSRSLPDIDVLLPKVARFNAWMLEHAEQIADLKMWSWQGNIRGTNVTPGPIAEATFREGTFIFLGKAWSVSEFDPHAALQLFDRLLPLYQAVELEGSSEATPISPRGPSEPLDETLQLDKGRETQGGRWITASIKERSLNIFLRHAEIQRRLKEALLEERCKKVLCEVPIGSRLVDVIAWHGDAIWMFEIKTGLTVRSCLREALGQLLEYALWPGATRPERLVVVGTPAIDKKAQQYIAELNRAFPVPVSYRQIALD